MSQIDIHLIKGVIFDFDMTLVDSAWIGKRACKMLEKNHGISSSGLEIKEAFGMNFFDFCKKLSELNHNKLSPEEIAKFDLYYMQEGYREVEIKEIKLLKYLSDKNIRIGIVSHGKSENIELVLNKHNQEISFDFVRCASNSSKNGKDILIKEALKDWEIKKNECIYVGDHPNDIIAAKNAGVISIGISSGMHTDLELKEYNPDFLIKSLSELKKLI